MAKKVSILRNNDIYMGFPIRIIDLKCLKYRENISKRLFYNTRGAWIRR